jgi:predicted outer membrane protein
MKRHILLATVAALAFTPALAQQSQSQTTTQTGATQQSQGAATAKADATTAQGFVEQAAMINLFEVASGQLALEKSENQEVKDFAQHIVTDHTKATQRLASVAEEANVEVAALEQMMQAGGMQAGASGSAQAGTATSGTATAGSATSGTATAGSATSGTATAGSVTGGSATGGSATGGSAMGGSATGGSATGGSAMGGSATGGSAQMAASGAMGAQMAAMLDKKHQQTLERLRGLSGEEFEQEYMQVQVDAHQMAIDLFEQYSENGDEEALKTFAEQVLPTLREHLEHAERVHQEVQG